MEDYTVSYTLHGADAAVHYTVRTNGSHPVRVSLYDADGNRVASAEGCEGVLQVPDAAAAFDAAERAAGQDGATSGKCFVIGGAKTYERTMDEVDRLYITHVRTCVEDADAFFPSIDPSVWVKESETEPETDPENGLGYTFAVYVRRK